MPGPSGNSYPFERSAHRSELFVIGWCRPCHYIYMRRALPGLVLLSFACGGAAADEGADPVPRGQAAQAIADQVCSLQSECECADAANCTLEVESDARNFMQGTADAGLQYDAQCMGDMLQRLDEIGCAHEDAIEDPSCTDTCKPLFGSKGQGEQCSRVAVGNIEGFGLLLDDCDAEHICIADTCQPRCWVLDGKPEGEECLTPPVYCQEGLECDPSNGTCGPPPAPGGPCDANYMCPGEQLCTGQDMTCVPLPDIGQDCLNGRCAEGWCDFSEMTCRALLEQDESCTSFEQCESGYCPNGTCQQKPDLGEPCYGPCQDGLACFDEVCVTIPADVCG